jgi:hypothetical protein
MSEPGDITAEMLEAMPDEYKHELLLLFQVLNRLRLARISSQLEPSPDSPFDLGGLRESKSRPAIKRVELWRELHPGAGYR